MLMRASTAAVIKMNAKDGPAGLAAATNAEPVVDPVVEDAAVLLPVVVVLPVVPLVPAGVVVTVVLVVVSVPLQIPRLLQQLTVEPSQHLAANFSTRSAL